MHTDTLFSCQFSHFDTFLFVLATGFLFPSNFLGFPSRKCLLNLLSFIFSLAGGKIPSSKQFFYGFVHLCRLMPTKEQSTNYLCVIKMNLPTSVCIELFALLTGLNLIYLMPTTYLTTTASK